MRITSADVISLNGKITKAEDDDASTWASAEEQAYFRRLLNAHDVLIMGRNTYEVVQPKLEEGRLRLILTRQPDKYRAKTVPGQLEFTNLAPHEMVEALKKRGFERALLVGGWVNSQFWAAGLVDEAFITIEPLVFGRGRDFLGDVETDVNLRLLDVKRLNEQGTLLAHYLVEKQPTLL